MQKSAASPSPAKRSLLFVCLSVVGGVNSISRSPAACTRKGCWPERAAGPLPRRRAPSGPRPLRSSPGAAGAHPPRTPIPRRRDQPPPGVRQKVPASRPPTGGARRGRGAGEDRGRCLRPEALAAVRRVEKRTGQDGMKPMKPMKPLSSFVVERDGRRPNAALGPCFSTECVFLRGS